MMPRSKWEPKIYADEVVEDLFPIDGSGEIAVLRCCIDSSTQNGVFTVAGVTYGLERAKKANRHWNAALANRVFHMSDLNARRGEFEGVGDDEVMHIMRETVGQICSLSSSVVAVSCDLELVAPFLPRLAEPGLRNDIDLRSAYKSAYGTMCHLCMMALGNRSKGHREISYTFEAGDDGQRGLLRYLDHIEASPYADIIRDRYSFRRKSVGTKDDIEGVFHSADLVAWEWGRQVSRERCKKKPRKSFLLIKEKTNNYLRHFSSEELAPFLAVMGKLIEAQSKDEIKNALDYWRQHRRTA